MRADDSERATQPPEPPAYFAISSSTAGSLPGLWLGDGDLFFTVGSIFPNHKQTDEGHLRSLFLFGQRILRNQATSPARFAVKRAARPLPTFRFPSRAPSPWKQRSLQVHSHPLCRL